METANYTSTLSRSSKSNFTAKADTLSQQCKTVLIIDDDEIVLTTSEMMLESLGYQVLKAHNGPSGLRLYKAHKQEIDLIISDLQMPKMNGIELLAELREIDPLVKVILSSGALIESDEIEVLFRGFSGFIKKPYNLETLQKKVVEIIN